MHDVCDLELQLPNTLNKKYGYLSSNVTINCNGADRDEPYLYEIHALGYGEAHQTLNEDEVRMMKGRLIAVNSSNTTSQSFFYEVVCALKIGESDTFPDPLHDPLTVTSAGIIKSTTTMVEACKQTYCCGEDSYIPQITTVLIVCHSDWHPLVSFFI